MGNIGAVGPEGYSELQTGSDIPSAAIPTPEQVVVGNYSTLQTSDQELVEELISMLPKSSIDPQLAATLWLSMPANMGIETVGRDYSSVDQHAIVMAVLANWGKSIEADAEALRDEIQREATDPLVAALKKYIAQGIPNQSVDAVAMLQVIRNAPLIASGIQSADPNLIAAAFKIAEQQVILNILQNMSEEAAAFAELRKAEEKKIEVARQELQHTLLTDYLNDVRLGTQTLNQPALSIVFAGMIGGSEMQVPLIVDPKTGVVKVDPMQDSLVPAGQGALIGSLDPLIADLSSEVQNALQLGLSQLLVNAQMAACYWSIPCGLSISTALPADDIATNATLSAARSYAFTMVHFVMRPEFETFVQSVILKHVNMEQVPAERFDQFVATMKVVLLANALCALDKAETGGIVIRGADFKALLTGTSKPPLGPDDYRASLVQDIKTLVATLPDGGKVLLQSLYSYFDTNPRVDTMLDPSTAFITLSNPQYFRQAALSQGV